MLAGDSDVAAKLCINKLMPGPLQVTLKWIGVLVSGPTPKVPVQCHWCEAPPPLGGLDHPMPTPLNLSGHKQDHPSGASLQQWSTWFSRNPPPYSSSPPK